MAGKVDWAAFVQKIYEAYDKKFNDMIYPAVMEAGTKVLPTSQFCKTGALTESTKASLIELVEDVQMANGCEAVIMGTKTALAKLSQLVETQWITDSMKEERHTTGRIGLWEGIRLVEIPQAFANNDTTKKLVDNTKLLVMPVADNKFVKVFNEGDIVRAYELYAGDIFELSAEGFDGTPTKGAAVTVADKKVKIG